MMERSLSSKKRFLRWKSSKKVRRQIQRASCVDMSQISIGFRSRSDNSYFYKRIIDALQNENETLRNTKSALIETNSFYKEYYLKSQSIAQQSHHVHSNIDVIHEENDEILTLTSDTDLDNFISTDMTIQSKQQPFPVDYEYLKQIEYDAEMEIHL